MMVVMIIMAMMMVMMTVVILTIITPSPPISPAQPHHHSHYLHCYYHQHLIIYYVASQHSYSCLGVTILAHLAAITHCQRLWIKQETVLSHS